MLLLTQNSSSSRSSTDQRAQIKERTIATCVPKSLVFFLTAILLTLNYGAMLRWVVCCWVVCFVK
jgi:hypothetical protein